jgi:hypothetical protein
MAGVALGLWPATSLASGQPRLGLLSDAFDGNISSIGASFHSDGSRFVSFTDRSGQLVALDSATDRRSTVELSPCGTAQPPPPGASLVGVGGPDVFYPAGLSDGTLITFCAAGEPNPEQYRLIDLATGASRLVTFDPPPDDGQFNDLLGPGTVGLDWAEVVGGQPSEPDQRVERRLDGTRRALRMEMRRPQTGPSRAGRPAPRGVRRRDRDLGRHARDRLRRGSRDRSPLELAGRALARRREGRLRRGAPHRSGDLRRPSGHAGDVVRTTADLHRRAHRSPARSAQDAAPLNGIWLAVCDRPTRRHATIDAARPRCE